MLTNISVVILGYLSGSIATAVVVCRLLGLGDPRREGSRNPGASNVYRLYGGKAAILTLLGDLLKGVLPVILASILQAPDLVVYMTGMAAFFGHLYPLFFHFKGGKGVATLIGVLLATHWMVGLTFIVTWLVVALIFRYSSLSSITAAITLPGYVWLLSPSPAYVISLTVMAGFLTWKHRTNIKRLLAGTEPRLGKSRTT
ncbi:MAG: plsY [Gammaproteobacteria bacterium]|nr:plsY [Gammaproteobacteria bacterium]